MRTVAINICPEDSSRIIPPNCRNCDIWSTSLVTREVSAPRRCSDWVSADRSWMCPNARIRSVASADSDVR